MTSRGWWCVAGLLAVLALMPAAVPQPEGASLFVTRVNPRPRLLFAPGEYRRFADETQGARRASFEQLIAEINSRGTRPWNERDLQLLSQVIAASVLLDRGDARAQTYLNYARQSLRFFLDSHTYRRWSDSHDLVTEGSRWLEAVSLAHDWMYDRWSPEERSRMERWLRDEIEHWVGTNRLVRASASPFRNDAARGVSGLVLAGLTLFDVPEYEDAARLALTHAQPFYEAILSAHAYAGAGGGMAEGTFYGNFTAWAQTLTAEALYTGAGHAEAFERSPFYEGRLRYAAHAGWPGYLTNQFGFNVHQLAPVFGDARRGPTGSALYHRATVLLLGKRLPTTVAAREAYWVVNRQETSRPYTREWVLYDVLLWSPDVKPEAPTALTYREPSLGQVFSRSDWDDAATWMSFNAGPHLDTHQHYDAGNLTIYRGADLIVDSGSFDAFGSNHWYNYYVRTVAHNTITVMDPAERWEAIWGGVPDNLAVNDGGQRTASPLTPAPTLDEYLGNRVAYDHARIERYADARWGLYVRANLTNAYQNPAFQSTRPDGSRNRPKVTYVGRELVYLRRGAERRDTFVVFDRVVAADPGFPKAVLWHAREPFQSQARVARVDAGELRYEGAERYDFQTLIRFRQGARDARTRLFLTALAVDPIVVRDIGRRPAAGVPDHTTFSVGHMHRHVKDYFVRDPRGLVNPSRNTGAFGRPEWPPFNPPEQQWLWTDDLVGGWGRTRLEIQPAGARAADRFLTVITPADEHEADAPAVELARPADGQAVGAVIRRGGRSDVVIFSADPAGADMIRGTVDVPAQAGGGDLVVATLKPGTRYAVRAATQGGVRRIAVAALAGGAAIADAAGVIRVPLDSIPAASVSFSPVPGAAGASAPGSSRIRVEVAPGSGGAAGRLAGATSLEPANGHAGLVAITADDPQGLAAWAPRIARLVRAGELRLRERVVDSVLPGRTHERFTQMYKGVPVFGGDVTRSTERRRVVAIVGAIYQDITLDPVPALTTAEATRIFRDIAGGRQGPSRTPELMVLPLEDGGYALSYRARVSAADDLQMTFIDANSGDVLLAFSDLQRPVY